MKTVNVISNILYISSGLVFTSSFFIKDNEKAVNRRWLSVGLFAAGWGTQITGTVMANKKLISK